MMSEQSIASARASVMIYDDINKKWVPSGSSSGLSKVQIYYHTTNNTYRVVGRKLCDHEVVINCAISKGLKYNQATVTFHQWRDNKQVYGLNFSTREDAEAFARAMINSLDTLSNNSNRLQTTPPQMTPNNQHIYHPAVIYNGQSTEDEVEYRTREETASLERRLSNMQTAESPNGAPGHHRTSSAPPAPQPPGNGPLLAGPIPSVPPAPPPGPAWSGPPPATAWGAPPTPAPASGPPPPPPPPSMPRSSSSDGHETNSLAAQLQSARLKRISNTNTMPSNAKQSAENSGSSTSSSGSNYGTLGRGGMGSMASMMDEMAKTLARRRAAAEKKEDEEPPANHDKKWQEKTDVKMNNHHAGDESPKPIRKRFGSEVSEDFIQKAQVNGMSNDDMSSGMLSSDSEMLKQEILREIRRDLAKMKQEIIDAIRSDGIRR